MEDAALGVTLARFEGKLDLMAVQLLTLSNRDDDFENRIRAIEQKRVVTVPSMWAALVSVAAIVSVAMPILVTSYTNVGR